MKVICTFESGSEALCPGRTAERSGRAEVERPGPRARAARALRTMGTKLRAQTRTLSLRGLRGPGRQDTRDPAPRMLIPERQEMGAEEPAVQTAPAPPHRTGKAAALPCAVNMGVCIAAAV